MVDQWLDELTTSTPEKRARAKLRDLAATTRNTVKALRDEDDPREINYILCNHQAEVTKIIQRGEKPQPRWCQFCNEYKPALTYKPPATPQPWSKHWQLKLLWSLGLLALVLLFSSELGYWAVALLPVVWVIARSFFWTVVLPSLLFLVCTVLLSLAGITPL